MPQEDVCSSESAEWQAQYEFWTKLISDEVARRRFNEGFEPVDVELYELKNPYGEIKKFVGTTRICGRDFECTAYPGHEEAGNATLKLSIRVAKRKHH